MHTTYRANGKLLLTGEYLVLHGAEALVLPLNYGQNLEVTSSASKDTIQWTALHNKAVWFEGLFRKSDFKILHSTNTEVSIFLAKLFNVINDLSPEQFKGEGLNFTTRLEFNRTFGWGSSSTLIYLLAQWAGIDPYQLHFKVSKGSGYDIAAAGATGPIIYSHENNRINSEAVKFSPGFINKLYFVYLGKKQDTQQEVKAYLQKVPGSVAVKKAISEITRQLVKVSTFNEFIELLTKHEAILARELRRPRIQEKLFSDFNGLVKSLGAWGGDFVLLASEQGTGYVERYLKQHNFSTYYKFNDLILQPSEAKTQGYAGI